MSIKELLEKSKLIEVTDEQISNLRSLLEKQGKDKINEQYRLSAVLDRKYRV